MLSMNNRNRTIFFLRSPITNTPTHTSNGQHEPCGPAVRHTVLFNVLCSALRCFFFSFLLNFRFVRSVWNEKMPGTHGRIESDVQVLHTCTHAHNKQYSGSPETIAKTHGRMRGVSVTFCVKNRFFAFCFSVSFRLCTVHRRFLRFSVRLMLDVCEHLAL